MLNNHFENQVVVEWEMWNFLQKLNLELFFYREKTLFHVNERFNNQSSISWKERSLEQLL